MNKQIDMITEELFHRNAIEVIMDKSELYDNIYFLFNRHWDEELTDEEEDLLQEKYDKLVNVYGWETVFTEIDKYMRTECLDGDAACNFAHMYWGYNCYSPKNIDCPYSFLGFLFYRMNLEPWKYDAVDIMDGLVKDLLSTKSDKSHDPFWNTDYIPEKDPDIMAEVEKLRKENA